MLRNHCVRCHRAFGVEAITGSTGVPRCSCGGVIKPDVVLYGESLDDAVVSGAVAAIAGCDLLIIGGTSLSVWPAAGLIDYCRGKIALINRTPTPADRRADLLLHGSIGELMGD